MFHKACVSKWFGTGRLTCPICRTNIQTPTSPHTPTYPFQPEREPEPQPDTPPTSINLYPTTPTSDDRFPLTRTRNFLDGDEETPSVAGVVVPSMSIDRFPLTRTRSFLDSGIDETDDQNVRMLLEFERQAMRRHLHHEVVELVEHINDTLPIDCYPTNIETFLNFGAWCPMVDLPLEQRRRLQVMAVNLQMGEFRTGMDTQYAF